MAFSISRTAISDHVVLIAVSALFGCRLLLALALIPPWQQPDEPTHVGLVELQRARAALLDGVPDPAREREILSSMAEYDWWRHRGFPIPVTPPESFAAAGARVVVDIRHVTTPTPYYVVLGRFLSWLPRMSVVDDLYVLRAVSAAAAMLTLWLAWLGARECLGAPGGATVAVILALHPQVAVASTAASPDAIINLLGACVWWQTAVAVRRKRLLPALAVVWAAAIAAASADRVGVPLLVVASVVSVTAIALRMPFRDRKALLATALISGLVALTCAILLWTVDMVQPRYDMRQFLFGGWIPVPEAMSWDFFMRFTSFVVQSWWFSLGWIRYAAPSWWASVTIVLTVIAAIGIVGRLLGERDPQARALLCLAAVSVSVQVAALYWTYFRFGHGALGKSLFPYLVPCFVLLWTGLEAWVPRSRRMHAAVALVILFAFLDSAVWLLVGIPAYV